MKIRLKDAFDLQMGKTPARNTPAYWNGGYKWVSIADIGSAGKYITATKEGITDKAITESGIRAVPAHTVIMSFKLSIGKTAITSEKMYTNEAIMAFVDNGTYDIDTNYLYHLCCGTRWTEGTNKAVMGLTLNKATLSEKRISLPEITEQRNIAAKFDALDNVIEKTQAELSSLDQLVKSRFVEMFGDPIINEKKWATKKLDKACIAIVDCPHSTPNYTSENTGYMCIRTSIVKKNRIMWEKIEYIKEDEYYTRIQRKRPGKGDIIYTREGAILGIAAVIDRECNVALGQRSMLLSPDKKQCTSEFLSVAMNCDSFLSNALKGQSGSASPHINVGDIKDFQMIMPPISQQRQFSAFVSEVDKSKLAVKQSLEKLETLKKSLMQQYFG